MKCIDNAMDSFDYYKIFVIFGVITFFLTGWMIYSTLATFAKNKITRLMAFIVSLLCLMGYPLNSFLFGFEYLSMGLLIFVTILACINIYHKNEISYGLNLLVFFLLNFGLFTAYYMLVPYTYSGLWIYFCYTEYKKQNKLFSARLITILVITLLIPFILGFIYHIAPNIYAILIDRTTDLSNAMKYSESLLSSGIAQYGYIYVNIFSNMILLLPFAIVAMYKNWKEDKAIILITLLCIAFIILLLIGALFNRISYYYLTKNYFALWILLFYLTYKGLIIVYEKHKLISIMSVSIYVSIVIWNLLFGHTVLMHGLINPDENIWKVADIYGINKIILKKPVDLNLEELELLKYARDNISKDKTLEVAGDLEQGFWTYVILRRVNNDQEEGGQYKLTLKMQYVNMRAGKVDYLLYFKRGFFYNYYKNILMQNTEVVYENETGGILQYIK